VNAALPLRLGLLAILATGLLGPTAARPQEHWPQFRGPQARGVADGQNLPQTWSATEHVAWKRDLPGLGWSCPIVWGNRVWITTAVGSTPVENPRKGLYLFGENLAPPDETYQWKLLCFDLHTGELLWERVCHEGKPERARHSKNSYASETPVTDGERVYACFGDLGVFCYDLEGNPQWSVRWPSYRTRMGWGPAASPVCHGGRLYVVRDNEEHSHLLAIDARTGEEVWRVERDEGSNWATPFIWENELRTEIITPGSNKVRAYDLEGQLLYEFGGMSSIAIPTPFAAGGLLYVSSGYVLDRAKPIFAVRPGAAGDISLPGEDVTSNEFIVWCQHRAGPYNTSPLVYGDYLYVLLDGGMLACYEAHTGKEVYGRQRIPGGRAFTASPWAYDGRIFCLEEDGQTHVFEAGPEFRHVGTNPLEEDDMALATPAMAQGRLLIRTSKRLYCLAEK
jgi:outer membrane protein assembly factor BamB